MSDEDWVLIPPKDELQSRLDGIQFMSPQLQKSFQESVFPCVVKELAGREFTYVGIVLHVVHCIQKIHFNESYRYYLVHRFAGEIIDAICDDAKIAERAKADIRISYP